MRDKFEILDMYNNYKISQLDIFWKKKEYREKNIPQTYRIAWRFGKMTCEHGRSSYRWPLPVAAIGQFLLDHHHQLLLRRSPSRKLSSWFSTSRGQMTHPQRRPSRSCPRQTGSRSKGWRWSRLRVEGQGRLYNLNNV